MIALPSTRAGVAVSKAGADTVKRIALELGGKSPNIILDDADFKKAVASGMIHMANNTGQSCNAPSRMLAPKQHYEEIVAIAAATANAIKVQNPAEAEPRAIGPLANANQFQKVQALIQKGIDEGARVAAGGVGRPEGFNRGYFVRPTVFADVTPQMTIAREKSSARSGDLPYGVRKGDRHGQRYALRPRRHVQGSTERARAVARRLRPATCINGASPTVAVPFGGYNNRAWPRMGQIRREEFLGEGRGRLGRVNKANAAFIGLRHNRQAGPMSTPHAFPTAEMAGHAFVAPRQGEAPAFICWMTRAGALWWIGRLGWCRCAMKRRWSASAATCTPRACA